MFDNERARHKIGVRLCSFNTAAMEIGMMDNNEDCRNKNRTLFSEIRF
jgi:hypothetical protein